MPEGDTIYRAARTLDRALGGEQIVGFRSELAQLSRLEGTPDQLVGRTVEKVHSRGKHLLIDLSGSITLRTHMRMSGSWHIYRPGERWRYARSRARIVLETPSFIAVGFAIVEAEIVKTADVESRSRVSRLGPDLLAENFDAERALDLLRSRGDTEIGVALLNQTLLAGIGNVYKSETLFLCAINPFASVASIDPDRLESVVTTARELLWRNVRPGGNREGIRTTTRVLNPAEALWVYGRRGKPCRRCGTAIQRALQGGDARSTYWCSSCQPDHN